MHCFGLSSLFILFFFYFLRIFWCDSIILSENRWFSDFFFRVLWLSFSSAAITSIEKLEKIHIASNSFFYVPHRKLAEMFTRKASWDFLNEKCYVHLIETFFSLRLTVTILMGPKIRQRMTCFVCSSYWSNYIFFLYPFGCFGQCADDVHISNWNMSIGTWLSAKVFNCNMNCRISVVSHCRIRK